MNLNRPVDHVYSLVLRIEHPLLETPIEHIDMLRGPSLSAVVKPLKLSNEQICKLKNYGSASWIDPEGGIHTLTIKEELSL